MHVSRLIRLGFLPVLVALVQFLMPNGASAHERRDLPGSRYQAVVGFLSEPAIENQFNGIDLTVTDTSQKDAAGGGRPVEGLERTLKAEISAGGLAPRAVQLVARFGVPGKYAGYFIPTQMGQYTFHIFGSINGQSIDERFESGPGRFNDVQSLSDMQYPNRVVVPANLQSQLDAAQSTADTARTFAVIGLVIGILGLGAAGIALARFPVHRLPVVNDGVRERSRV
jgi:hypothetical protein